jgi:hypothetical protein
MRQANALRLMLDRLAVHDGCLENLCDTSVNGVTLHVNSVSNLALPVWYCFGDEAPLEEAKTAPHRTGLTYKIFNSAARRSEHNWLRVIWLLALGLCVHSDKVKLLPHEFHQLVNVPSVLGADRNRIGDSIQEIELLNADGIDLV